MTLIPGIGAAFIHRGSYTGNGSSLSITTDITPALVIIATERTAGGPSSRALSWKFASMPSDTFIACANQAREKNGITIVDGGFNLGSAGEVNTNGIVHHWMALPSGGRMEHGQYTGTGTTNSQVIDHNYNLYNFFFSNRNGATVDLGLKNTFFSTGYTANHKGNITISDGQVYTREIPSVPGTANNVVTVSGNANILNEVYDYLAFSDAGTSTRFSDASGVIIALSGIGDNFVETSYWENTGSAGDTQEVVLGWQPTVILMSAGGTSISLKTDTMPSNEVGVVDDARYDYETGCTITASGFIIDTTITNPTGFSYYWAWG
jgi:hypothetical protein